MGHVDEVGPRRIDLGSGFDGLLNRKVGWMRAMAECIENQGFGGLERGHGFVGDARDIGAVGQGEEVGFWMVIGVEEESEDGELAVVEGDWGDMEPEEGEGLVRFDDVGDELGDE